MLILFTCASLTLAASVQAHVLPIVCDTIKSQDQNTVGRRDTNLILRNTLLQERPDLRSHAPLNILFGQQIDQRHFAGAVDSLLRAHPEVRGPLLRELLIPSAPLVSLSTKSAIKSFNEQLFNDSRLSPFERMSLIAKRYQLYHANDNTLKSQQLDIVGTIKWLLEIFK